MSYHVRRKDREIIDQSELNQIIARNKYATLALCHNNEPYIVTLTYGYDNNTKTLYFHCSKEGLKLDFIKKNPNTCLTIIEDNGFDSKTCNHPYTSLVIRGKIELIYDTEESNNAITLMIDQLEFENKERPLGKLNQNNKVYQNLQMVKVEIMEITGKEKRKNP
jgi:nitroimidazol reductase NimA-like FMN-containing flavoprotein (pyridoxamine 5'-phosphate oxidase superfamily)